MFDGSIQVAAGEMSGGRTAWRDLDRQLRVVAKRRGALDHEELQLIRKAIVLALWRELGMVSMREYLEHVMGYGPNVASERIRVAEALGAMPALEAALGAGDHPHCNEENRRAVGRGVPRQEPAPDRGAARRA